jgi:hypothetical protein
MGMEEAAVYVMLFVFTVVLINNLAYHIAILKINVLLYLSGTYIILDNVSKLNLTYFQRSFEKAVQ